MTDSPRVSVIVLSHRKEFFPTAIQSVLAQTYPNVEIILKYHPEYSTTKFQESWQSASGKYLAFLPDDDTLEPEFCERLVSVAEAAGADLAFSDHYVTGPLKLKWQFPLWDREILRLACVPFMTFVVRTDFWREIGGWDGALMYSDWDAAIRMYAGGARVVQLRQEYLWNRTHHGNAGSANMTTADSAAALLALRDKHPVSVLG